MRILIIGDSLVEGVIGINYVQQLQEENPEDVIVNRGIGGDTLKNIINRLLREMEIHSYDAVVLTGGHNDLVLPHVRQRGQKWEQFVRQIIRGGAVLTESDDELVGNLEMLARTMKQRGIPLIVTTLTPLGENLSSQLNLRRSGINHRIRGLHDVVVCDVAQRFEDALGDAKGPDYLMNSLQKLLEEDFLRCERGEDLTMSEERGLTLTIDGAHLNRHGAALYLQALTASLNEVRQ